MIKSCWVLTKEYNDYDQYGEYYVCVFEEKPDFAKLKQIIDAEYEPADRDDPKVEEVVGNLIRKGGGRIRYEFKWFFLKNVEMT